MVVLIASILAVTVLVLAAFLVRRILSTETDLPLNAEWIDELSVERYRPMMRLLDNRDLMFVASQPGFTPRMVANLRRQRARIFRAYLRCLGADFRRVCTAVKLLMQHSGQDRPDLASALVRYQAAFVWGMALVEVRVWLFRWGLCTVDVKDLVKTFDLMRLELRTLAPSALGAAA